MPSSRGSLCSCYFQCDNATPPRQAEVENNKILLDDTTPPEEAGVHNNRLFVDDQHRLIHAIDFCTLNECLPPLLHFVNVCSVSLCAVNSYLLANSFNPSRGYHWFFLVICTFYIILASPASKGPRLVKQSFLPFVDIKIPWVSYTHRWTIRSTTDDNWTAAFTVP